MTRRASSSPRRSWTTRCRRATRLRASNPFSWRSGRSTGPLAPRASGSLQWSACRPRWRTPSPPPPDVASRRSRSPRRAWWKPSTTARIPDAFDRGLQSRTADVSYVDPSTGRTYSTAEARWCADNGHYLNLGPGPGLGRGDIDASRHSVWRYAKALLVGVEHAVTLG